MAGLVALPLKIFSVALFLNDFITRTQYHGYHAMSIYRLAEQAACGVAYEKPKVIPLCSSDRLAVPVSDIESKADCPPDISHLCRGQGCDQGTDFPP